jgi:protein-S-isoprenylcysteine O-methyltransferase Ste14
MSSSPAAARTISTVEHPASTWPQNFAAFLIRRRILISAILFGLMIAKDVVYGPRPRDPFYLRNGVTVLGVLLVGGGLALRSWAAGILHKNAELTTAGPYGLIRNPLYVGSFSMMFGFCLLIGDPVNFLFILGPVLLIYVVQVRQEERLLATRFPQEWAAYAKSTPRFFPRLRRVGRSAEWQFSQWIHHREYQAIAASLAALAAIEVWHVM